MSTTTNNKTSFSNYTKQGVFAEYEKCCKKGDFESACFWVMEIYLSGWYETWKLKAIIFGSKYIHIENPSIPEALVNFPKNRKEIEIAFGITGILSMSTKGTIYQLPKISEDHLSTTFLMNKFVSIHPIVTTISKKNENEVIQYTISLILQGIQEGDINKAILWLGWTITLEKLQKKCITTNSRSWKQIPPKYTTDWIWFFWEALLKYNQEDTTRYHIIQCLLVMFATDYKTAHKTQLVSCLIHAILLSTVKNIQFKSDPFIDRKRISAALQKIDYMHNMILKKNQGVSYNYEVSNKTCQKRGTAASTSNSTSQSQSSTDIVDKLLFNI